MGYHTSYAIDTCDLLPLYPCKEVRLLMSITQIFIWILIAAVVGFIGELLARRHAPDGIVGAIVVGFIAIVLIVGVFHFSIPGEPKLSGVPLISSIIVAAVLVAIWSAFAYRRVPPLLCA